MKNLIAVLMLTHAALSCFGQINYCKNCTSTQDHGFDNGRAGALIKNFKNNFTVKSYGGTIYGDLNYFKTISTAIDNNTLAIKFLFCLDTVGGTDNIFLAFQNDNCPSSGTFSSGQATTNSKRSSDNYFSAVSGSLIHKYSTQVQNHVVYPDDNLATRQSRQSILASTVQSAYERFRDTPRYSTLLECTEKMGYFILYKSIKQIFDLDPTKCEGIRYYFGYDPALHNKIRVILVGVDSFGANLRTWRETSIPYNKSEWENMSR